MMKIDDRTIYPAMISHPSRDEVRERTMASLERVAPRLVRDVRLVRNEAPLGPENHHANVMATLNAYRKSNRPYLLFMEDDLEFCPIAFPLCLHETLRTYPESIWSFCVIGKHGIPKRVRDILKTGRWDGGFFHHPVKINRRDYFGSQCFLMSRRFVDELMRSGMLEAVKPEGWRGAGERMHFDNAVASYCLDSDTKMHAWWPNPVQHTERRKTWTKSAQPTPSSYTYPHALVLNNRLAPEDWK